MKTEYLLKIRDNPERTFASVWLLARQGAGDACLLYGELTPALAEQVAEGLGLPVQHEEWLIPKMEPFTPSECVPLAQQKELFEVSP